MFTFFPLLIQTIKQSCTMPFTRTSLAYQLSCTLNCFLENIFSKWNPWTKRKFVVYVFHIFPIYPSIRSTVFFVLRKFSFPFSKQYLFWVFYYLIVQCMARNMFSKANRSTNASLNVQFDSVYTLYCFSLFNHQVYPNILQSSLDKCLVQHCSTFEEWGKTGATYRNVKGNES